ncbi:MAG: GNAT family N-acetyltransferase [Alphaproteobacteria bacterium]
MFSYKIDKLSLCHLNDALELIWSVFLKCDAPDYSEEGIETFKKVIDRQSVEAKFINGEIDVIGCWDGDKLVGVLAIRKPSHVWLMFVAEKYHRQGVAKNMFFEFLLNISEEKITVNSTPYAVKTYEKLGFVAQTDEQLSNGIRFVPMLMIK